MPKYAINVLVFLVCGLAVAACSNKESSVSIVEPFAYGEQEGYLISPLVLDVVEITRTDEGVRALQVTEQLGDADVLVGRNEDKRVYRIGPHDLSLTLVSTEFFVPSKVELVPSEKFGIELGGPTDPYLKNTWSGDVNGGTSRMTAVGMSSYVAQWDYAVWYLTFGFRACEIIQWWPDNCQSTSGP